MERNLIDLIDSFNSGVGNDTGDSEPRLFNHSPYYDSHDFIELFKSKKDIFNVLSLNCQSLNAKFNELLAYIETFEVNNCHVSAICLQETWIRNDFDLAYFEIPGYNLISYPSSCSTHGGVAIYLNKCFDYKVLDLYNDSNVWDGLFIEVKLNNKSLIIGNIYRPPRELLDNYNIFVEDLESIFNCYEVQRHETIVVGDFNIDLLKMFDRPIFKEFFDTFMTNGFIPKITMPTRISSVSSTLIDNMFIKISDDFSSSTAGILSCNISDHFPCFLFLDYIHMNNNKPQRYVRRRFVTSESLTSFKDEVNAKCMEFVGNMVSQDPNVNYDALNKILCDAYDKHLPVKISKFNKYKHKKHKWITSGILNSIKFRDKLYNRLKRTSRDNPMHETLSINLRTYNRILKQNIRLAKRTYYENCFHQFKGDIKQTWNIIKDIINKSKDKNDIPQYFLVNNIKVSDHKLIATEFNRYFVDIGPKLASKINPPVNLSFRDYLNYPTKYRFQFHEVDVKTVSEIINDLKSKSSAGQDGISNKLLKLIKTEVSPLLTIIINQSFLTGIFPEGLKIAKITPIFKNGDSCLFNNYRPVSVLPSISKVFERVMYNQVITYFNEYNLLYDSQYGFRKNHSTELAAIEFIDRALAHMDNNKLPLNIFLDLSKAFDTLDHDILVYKLNHYGITGSALKLFQTYLLNRKQYVLVNNTESDCLYIKTGVPQGSILGPLLFIIYLNDIVKVCKLFHPIIYADDTTLCATLDSFGNNSELIEENINSELNDVVDWLKLNRLSVNAMKTKGMIFHTQHKALDVPNIKMDNVRIDFVDEFSFLGITVDKHLSWKGHVNKIHLKISKVIGIMCRLKNVLPSFILLQIYNSLVTPYFNYGILTWGPSGSSLHKVQKKAVRIVAKAKYNAHTEPILKNLNLLRVSDICVLQELKFCYKLSHNQLPKYFSNSIFHRMNEIHTHDTRFMQNFQIPLIRHEYARNSMKYRIPKLYNSFPKIVTEKINTHSLHGFSNYAKKFLLDSYSSSCVVSNCYVCCS